MRGSRVFFCLYIYMGFLVILYLNKSGPGRVWQKPRSDSDPLRVFLKTHTQPYYLSDQVKSDPLRSGRIGYPRVRLLLPSLLTSIYTCGVITVLRVHSSTIIFIFIFLKNVDEGIKSNPFISKWMDIILGTPW